MSLNDIYIKNIIMKKNLFLITEDERDRILGMHIKATASQYLSEDESQTEATDDSYLNNTSELDQ